MRNRKNPKRKSLKNQQWRLRVFPFHQQTTISMIRNLHLLLQYRQSSFQHYLFLYHIPVRHIHLFRFLQIYLAVPFHNKPIVPISFFDQFVLYSISSCSSIPNSTPIAIGFTQSWSYLYTTTIAIIRTDGAVNLLKEYEPETMF